MRTANPALNESTFTQAGRMLAPGSADSMSLDGTVNKTAILVACALATASFTWSRFFAAGPGSVGVFMLLGIFGGLLCALITVFKRTAAPVTAPLYAAFEGLFLGGISATLEAQFPGIVIQAVALTFGTLVGLLLAYKSGFIRATENFKLGVVAATGAIALFYLASMVLGFFGMRVPFIHESGLIGIGFSLFVVAIAALNLVLDFDFIEHGTELGLPKYMEWYAAFGLLVTLVWLYLEILRLLAKLHSRRD